MNWIQKHALSVLLRADEASLKEMRPAGVDSNLFSYHIHYLKSRDIIESVARGKYRLTTNGMHVAGTFNSATGAEAHDVKTVIMLYARRGDEVLLFKWSRHPYFGAMTLPHDRYNYGNSLQEALSEAVADKLRLSVEQARPEYLKSGIVHIYHEGERISSMSVHAYTVDTSHITETSTRNGHLCWGQPSEGMLGLKELVEQLSDAQKATFEAILTY